MILEDRVKGVSNRCSKTNSKADKLKNTQYLTEINSAIKNIVDSYQEDTNQLEPIVESDDQEPPYLLTEETSQPKESFYQEEKRSNPAEEYQEELPEKEIQEEDSRVMDNEEAQETIQKQMMAAMFKTENSSYQENENFKNWMLTHPTELKLFEQLSTIKTGNVNYGQLF